MPLARAWTRSQPVRGSGDGCGHRGAAEAGRAGRSRFPNQRRRQAVACCRCERYSASGESEAEEARGEEDVEQ